MRLMLVKKHQVPKFKVIFIMAIQMILFSKNHGFDKGVPKFLSRRIFPLFSFIMYRNNVCFTLILVISIQSKWTSINGTYV